MPLVTHIALFVLTRHLDGAIDFVDSTLGSACTFHARNDAILRLSADDLRLIAVDEDCEIGEQMIYLDCDDADPVYARMKSQLGMLTQGRVRAPFDEPQVMREFNVRDNENCLLLFGTDIPPSP